LAETQKLPKKEKKRKTTSSKYLWIIATLATNKKFLRTTLGRRMPVI
jgi:hypothetical protein